MYKGEERLSYNNYWRFNEIHAVWNIVEVGTGGKLQRRDPRENEGEIDR